MSFVQKEIHTVIASVIIVVISAIIWNVPVTHAAVTLETLPDNKSYGDFVVGPGKIEVELSPGETRTINLTVANRLGTNKIFTLGVEDFTGSNDPNSTVVLLGDDRGPYSLRDYIHPATTSIDIQPSMRARIPIVISIPADAQPGGLYGSVIVGTLTRTPTTTPEGGAMPSSPIITRIGTLFFVRVKGPVLTDGHLEKFQITGNRHFLWDSQPVAFDVVYKNDGNVHLDPYGTVSITNMLGSTVGSVDVEPWFAMPQSLRFRQVAWNPPFLLGRYTAHAEINRGYGSTTDQMDVSFWVIPWKILLGALIAIVIVIVFITWIFSKFTIVSKK